MNDQAFKKSLWNENKRRFHYINPDEIDAVKRDKQPLFHQILLRNIVNKSQMEESDQSINKFNNVVDERWSCRLFFSKLLFL